MWVLVAGGQRESSSLRGAILPFPCDRHSVSSPGESESLAASEFAVAPLRESSQVMDGPLPGGGQAERILQLAREVCLSGTVAGFGAGADALVS